MPRGRTRAELRVDGDQSVALRFKDADGMPRLTVGTENGAALIVLNEHRGKLRAGLVALPHGAPGLIALRQQRQATRRVQPHARRHARVDLLRSRRLRDVEDHRPVTGESTSRA